MWKLLGVFIGAALITGCIATAEAASKKKTHTGLSQAEKAKLRKEYMKICTKRNPGLKIERVQVRSDGSIVCWEKTNRFRFQ